ncbi:hypothetical protein FP828_05110 [bacterium]|nr:hypothetical protein [bacterium]
MKQNMRLGVRKLLFVSVMIFAAFTLTAKDVFSADYIPDPVLVETVDVPPVPVGVTVELEASPDKGFAPLSVAFTCTATAEIHYADERWAMPPQGSVEKIVPLYKKVPANIIEQPIDLTIYETGTYNFTAVAEYQGMQAEKTVTVKVKNCLELQAAVDTAEQEYEIATAKVQKALADVSIAEANIAEANAGANLITSQLALRGFVLIGAMEAVASVLPQIVALGKSIDITAGLLSVATAKTMPIIAGQLAELVKQYDALYEMWEVLEEVVQGIKDEVVALVKSYDKFIEQKYYWQALLPHLEHLHSYFLNLMFPIYSEWLRLARLLEQCKQSI